MVRHDNVAEMSIDASVIDWKYIQHTNNSDRYKAHTHIEDKY